MYKIGLTLSLAFILVAAYAFAQEESFTITTYYPSPYGSYNALQTNRLAVGDTNNDGQLTDADQPNRDGDIRLKPQSGDPTTSWAAGREGQFAYSSTNDELYHYNGSAWVAQGGGGIAVISLKCMVGSTTGGGWVQCTPPACPVGWSDRGTGCVATCVSWNPMMGIPMTAGYCERWCTRASP